MKLMKRFAEIQLKTSDNVRKKLEKMTFLNTGSNHFKENQEKCDFAVNGGMFQELELE